MNSTPDYYDLPVQILRNSQQFTIHRKRTFTDSIIPYDSFHHPEHRQTAMRILLDRLNTYELNTSGKPLRTKLFKRPGRGFDYPPHLAPRLKKEQSYTSPPPLGSRGQFQGELYLYLYYAECFLLRDSSVLAWRPITPPVLQCSATFSSAFTKDCSTEGYGSSQLYLHTHTRFLDVLNYAQATLPSKQMNST